MMNKVVTTPTRYERVREILCAAAGASASDYGGVGRFWELPLEQFLEVRVCGERMIAPVVETAPRSCCGAGHGEETPAASEEDTPQVAATPGRGARSGLIKGLRGQPPFDGSRFPRLPWGGTAVSDADIQFISDWIDDGCQSDDHEIGSYPFEILTAATTLEEISADNLEPPLKVVGEHAFEVYAGPSNEYKYRRGELKQRMNIDCMDEAQLERLRLAFRNLYALNKWPEDGRSYSSLAQVHQDHCQHGWERFVPWHRIYMYEFEQALQDHCPDVTMPYWDWTMPQYCPHRPEKGWRIPKALQAYLTDESIDYLKSANPSLPPDDAETLRRHLVGNGLKDRQYFASQQQFFCKVAELIGPQYTLAQHRERFIDALLAANALWYPLRYPGEYTGPNNEPSTITKVIHYHYPTADDIAQIMSLRTFRDFGGGSLYNDSFGFLDQNPHNTMHIWTGGMNPQPAKDDASAATEALLDRNRGVQVAGRRFHKRSDMYSRPRYGDMFSNLTASYDPVFWPVHANVDRLWWDWQQMHPHSLPADLNAVLKPWSYTIHDTLDIYQFGYEYVKSTYIIPVGMEAPVGHFVSRPIEIPETVRTSFRQAEVRLHQVPQLPRSCFIRVFLNLPTASAETSTEDERYAGYLAVFGHGPCYGGPGHCALPPAQPRKFDLRPRSHNTPRNHRIDVTNCAQRLLGAGASSLQITLVVIGPRAIARC